MECKCGGQTTDRQVIRAGKRVGWYAKCTACARIHWRQRPPAQE